MAGGRGQEAGEDKVDRKATQERMRHLAGCKTPGRQSGRGGWCSSGASRFPVPTGSAGVSACFRRACRSRQTVSREELGERGRPRSLVAELDYHPGHQAAKHLQGMHSAQSVPSRAPARAFSCCYRPPAACWGPVNPSGQPPLPYIPHACRPVPKRLHRYSHSSLHPGAHSAPPASPR